MKHYNVFALQGDTETTDQEVCETLGLDPKLANTPELNEAAIKLMHRQNYDGFVANGMEPEDALELADVKASQARSFVNSLLKEQ
jgi:DNA-binding LacI/PurR family transcriptional regulator